MIVTPDRETCVICLAECIIVCCRGGVVTGILCVAEVELCLVFCVLQRWSCDWCFVCYSDGVVTGVVWFCVLQRQSCDAMVLSGFVCCRGMVVTGVLCVAEAEL